MFRRVKWRLFHQVYKHYFMAGVRIVVQDILECGAGTVVVHQCNCQTKDAAGLARDVFNKWPDADDYVSPAPRTPGTIRMHSTPGGQFVCNFFSQNAPGTPCAGETAEMREAWFMQCLAALKEYRAGAEASAVAFPYKFGCGLAGGNWDRYLTIIATWAMDVAIPVVIMIKP